MEDKATKVNETLEEESRDFLSQATTWIFSNLFQSDVGFDFKRVMAPVLPELCDGIEKEVLDHAVAHIQRFVPIHNIS